MLYSECMNKHTIAIVAYVVSAMSMIGLVVGALALAEIIPMRYVWGGRIESRSQLITMETVTLLVNAVIVWLVGMQAGYIRPRLSGKILRAVMLVLSIMMSLNTFGNIAAKTNAEKLFALPTLVGAVGFWVLYKYGGPQEESK